MTWAAPDAPPDAPKSEMTYDGKGRLVSFSPPPPRQAPGMNPAVAAALRLGRPVKWIEDRTGNLISTGFARDFYMDGELALKADGTMTGLRVKMLSDQGYAFADAQQYHQQQQQYQNQQQRPPASDWRWQR